MMKRRAEIGSLGLLIPALIGLAVVANRGDAQAPPRVRVVLQPVSYDGLHERRLFACGAAVRFATINVRVVSSTDEARMPRNLEFAGVFQCVNRWFPGTCMEIDLRSAAANSVRSAAARGVPHRVPYNHFVPCPMPAAEPP